MKLYMESEYEKKLIKLETYLLNMIRDSNFI